MGVKIQAIKPAEFICDFETKLTEEQEDNGNICPIYTLDFMPIKHLTQFREGYWLCKCLGSAYLDMPCSTFNDFRRAVCAPIHGDWERYTGDVEAGRVLCDGAFAEFLWFADNEGCFDYVVAEKLLNDFVTCKDKIYPTLDKYDRYHYLVYTRILEECVRDKGVVYYR
ncbi:MAG: hypothetical protein OSJ34_07400 [Muribaculaceae bacterium]|nr:hypothetical protein [Muribaculaceae bacterium]